MRSVEGKLYQGRVAAGQPSTIIRPAIIEPYNLLLACNIAKIHHSASLGPCILDTFVVIMVFSIRRKHVLGIGFDGPIACRRQA